MMILNTFSEKVSSQCGLEDVIKMELPYPPEYQEMVYKAMRFSPGSGFDQLLTESKEGNCHTQAFKSHHVFEETSHSLGWYNFWGAAWLQEI